MNQREAKIVALGIAYRVLDAASPAEALEETGVAYHQDDVAKIEAELAAISRRLEERYAELLRTGRSFLSPFEKPLPPKTEEICPECGAGQVVIRHGRYGRFRGCSEYPTCQWKAPLVVGRCPACTGDLVSAPGSGACSGGARITPSASTRGSRRRLSRILGGEMMLYIFQTVHCSERTELSIWRCDCPKTLKTVMRLLGRLLADDLTAYEVDEIYRLHRAGQCVEDAIATVRRLGQPHPAREDTDLPRRFDDPRVHATWVHLPNCEHKCSTCA
jgi:hypothetical protein